MLNIIYEDNHLIAVNKESGSLIQSDRTGDRTLGDEVKEHIKKKYKKPGDVFLGVVHRLDRPVSGVVVFARTSKGLERMNKLFHDRSVTKTYWAITKNQPPQTEDTLTHWLKKNETANKTTAFNKEGKGAQKAVLSYRLTGRISEYYLLEVQPLTGRSHQIRAQLSKVGCPILGDVKYGASKPNKDASIHLHSRELSFIHPIKKEPVLITAKVPKNQIWHLF